MVLYLLGKGTTKSFSPNLKMDKLLEILSLTWSPEVMLFPTGLRGRTQASLLIIFLIYLK